MKDFKYAEINDYTAQYYLSNNLTDVYVKTKEDSNFYTKIKFRKNPSLANLYIYDNSTVSYIDIEDIKFKEPEARFYSKVKLKKEEVLKYYTLEATAIFNSEMSKNEITEYLTQSIESLDLAKSNLRKSTHTYKSGVIIEVTLNDLDDLPF